ncbi:MAG: XTP/dITP diphosphatase [Firmicutes bacterium]|nr:XTP/dITP diphosphatase [Bacillota bacterium]
MKLVIATKNFGKLAECRELLADTPFSIFSLQDYPAIYDIAETGHTLYENAALKAETVAKLTGELTLADDTGLEVDALGGRPGVYSARFAGVDASDADNKAELLRQLQDVPLAKRTARFRTVIALARPGQETSFVQGICEGIIGQEEQGNDGFGYDSLFFVPSLGVTFAQMTRATKNTISHRAQAMAQAQQFLEKMVNDAPERAN